MRAALQMKVLRARHAGFCSGVARAVQMAMDLVSREKRPLFTIGPLIHNPQEVQRLSTLGVVPKERIEDCIGNLTLIRTHGMAAEEVSRAESLGVKLLDATCPHVRLPRRHIQAFGKQGRTVLLLGDEGHPEVRALVSYGTGPVFVVRGPQDLPELPPQTPIGLVAQTTQSEEAFAQVLAAVRHRHADIAVENTICKDTRRRQEEGQWLARQVHAMVVVGGRNSANTGRLLALFRAIQPRTYQAETVAELQNVAWDGVKVVGLAAGASTPDWIIDEVEAWLRSKSG